jgi:hypothetical protein
MYIRSLLSQNQLLNAQQLHPNIGTQCLYNQDGTVLNLNNPDHRTTTTSVNQRYLDQRETNQINKVRRIVNEVFSDHGGVPRSQNGQGIVSKKASSIAATGFLTGKPQISSHDA